MTVRLFNAVLEVSVSVSAAVLLLFLFSPLLKKRFAAKWRYWVWLALAVRLLVPVNFHAAQPAVRIPVPQAAAAGRSVFAAQPAAVSLPRKTAQAAPKTETENTPEKPAAQQAQREQAAQPDAAALLPAVWAAGAAAFLLWRFGAYFVFLRGIRRWSSPVRGGRETEALRAQEAELGIRRGPVLLRCGKAVSPMMAGFFRPMLLLPETAYSEEDLRLILRHELIHWKRRDVWYKLLLCAANAVHWFNPVVWLMARRAGEDTELVCDSEVVKDFGAEDRRRYGQAILSSVRRGSVRGAAFSTYFSGGVKTLRKRFANILDGGRKKKGAAAFCALLAGVAAVGPLIACSDAAPKAQGGIDNIALLDSGNSFAVAKGKLVVTFGKDRAAITVPILVDQEYPSSSPADGSVYISDEVVAVAYGGENGEDVSVLVTQDGGKTWESSRAAGFDAQAAGRNYIGFTTREDGWLVTAGDPTEGRARNRVFETGDGGKSWKEVGNANAAYPHSLTGAGFADGSTGFLSFRSDEETDPVVFRTGDRGKTWARCSLSIPAAWKSSAAYAVALSPAFCGARGVLPVSLIGPGGETVARIRYETADAGKTWAYRGAASAASAGASGDESSGAESASYPMEECRDMTVTGQVLCGSYGTVVCGALKSDPKQGAAVVLWNGGKIKSARYLTPEKHGAVRAAVTDNSGGAKEDVFTVTAEDGYTWLFNLYNGFELGRGGGAQSAAASSSGPAGAVSAPASGTQEDVRKQVGAALETKIPRMLPTDVPVGKSRYLTAAVSSRAEGYKVDYYETDRPAEVNSKAASRGTPVATLEATAGQDVSGYAKINSADYDEFADLGHGVRAARQAGAGHQRMLWNEGSWYVDLDCPTDSAFQNGAYPDSMQLAKDVAAYLDRSLRSVPQGIGAVTVMNWNTTAETAVEWQCGASVCRVSSRDPMTALKVAAAMQPA